MLDWEWTVRRRSLRRRFVLEDAERASVGTLVAHRRYATAVAASGDLIDLQFDPAWDRAAMTMTASRGGSEIATLSETWVLRAGSRVFRWGNPEGRMAPITIREGDETVLHAERRPFGQARVRGALELPEPFAVAVMACVFAANGGPAGIERGMPNFGPGGT